MLQIIYDSIHIIYTEMQSLALALYFASRGIGTVDGTPYTTPARVLLSGLGSDELLGGYSRHRVAFRRGGWGSLVNEVGFTHAPMFPST